MLSLRSVEQLELSPGLRVFVAADLDVPLDRKGRVADDFRLQALLPTLQLLRQSGTVLVLGGHLGRPGGTIDPRFSLCPVKERLNKLLRTEVIFLENPLSPVSEDAIKQAGPGSIFLLENLRFSSQEKASDKDFGKKLAALAELFVNENFATSHRQDASVYQLPQFLPACAGLRLQEEVTNLLEFREDPPRPAVALVGGAKAEDKGPVASDLAKWMDTVLVGGKVGFALGEGDVPGNVILPVDGVEGKDIGPETIERFSKVLDEAQSVLWAGPLGIVEEKAYSRGSKVLAERALKAGKYVIIGGGDTLAMFEQFKLRDKVSWASVGGGAMLALLSAENLPALKLLTGDN